jgi:hypothetical protein
VFTVTNTGTATFSLTNTSLSNGGPPLAITIGFGVGTSTDGVCSIGYSVPASASSSPQITGTVNPGSLCVGVFDIGTMSANIDYSITVVHP